MKQMVSTLEYIGQVIYNVARLYIVNQTNPQLFKGVKHIYIRHESKRSIIKLLR